MENSRCQGRGENPSRTLRSCAGSCAAPSTTGSGAGDTLSIRSKPGSSTRPQKTKSNSGGFTPNCLGLGRQAQTSAVKATAPTKRNDVARITPRRRQIRGEEIIFSDRRDGIRDMVRFLHCYRTIHRLVGDNMGIACLRRQCRSDETLERFVRWRRCRFKPPALSSH
jgi:hypothetical protein